jgi:hypothetical protein
MIPVKEAVASAVEFAHNTLDPPPGDFRLEEVELGKTGPNDVWLITLSWPVEFTGLEFLRGRREYKVFTVRGDTGQVVSMKIRELASAQ